MWNKIAALMIIVTASSLLLAPIEVDARGGRGGGGRGGGGRSVGGAKGGGAYRGGRTMNRTPTMSCAANRPGTSQARQRPQNRLSVPRGNVQPGRQGVQQRQQRPSSANRAELRNQVGQYAKNRPAQNIDRQDLAKKAQDFSSKRGSQSLQNRQLTDRVRQQVMSGFLLESLPLQTMPTQLFIPIGSSSLLLTVVERLPVFCTIQRRMLRRILLVWSTLLTRRLIGLWTIGQILPLFQQAFIT